MGTTKKYRQVNYKLLEETAENKEKRVSVSTLKGVKAAMELFKNFEKFHFSGEFFIEKLFCKKEVFMVKFLY